MLRMLVIAEQLCLQMVEKRFLNSQLIINPQRKENKRESQKIEVEYIKILVLYLEL